MGLLCRGKSTIAVCNTIGKSSQPAKNSSGLQVFKFKDLEEATGGFAAENLIVKTSHGLVFKGTLKDGRVVAVKRPRSGARLWHDESAFENEMQILSKLFSRRLVNLLGHSQDGNETLLVVEHMINGSLDDCLRGCIDRAVPLSWPMRVHLALQVAKAIRALHASSPPIIHCNIRSNNVFIDKDWNARLGDFGLARYVQESEPPLKPRNLSSIPEVDTEEGASQFFTSLMVSNVDLERENLNHISTKTDVFSFGMLLLEIMSGRSAVSMDSDFTPFSLLHWALPFIKHGNAIAICDTRLKPPQVTAVVKQLGTIAARCVRASGSRRPSMDEIVHGLANVCKLLPLPMWRGLAGLRSRMKTTLHTGQTSFFTRACHSDHALCKASRFIRLPLWAGFLRLRKRKLALVFGFGKVLDKTLRLGTESYTRLPAQARNLPKSHMGSVKGSDTGRLRGGIVYPVNLQQMNDIRSSLFQPASYGTAAAARVPHCVSDKHAARIQIGNLAERRGVRRL